MPIPIRATGYILRDKEERLIALICDGKVYALSKCSDESIAELFNGGPLSLIPNAIHT